MRLFALATLMSAPLFGEGRCLKCEALKEYHENNPCPYEYYEEYLKACEEGKEAPKKLDVNDLVRKKQKIEDSSKSSETSTQPQSEEPQTL